MLFFSFSRFEFLIVDPFEKRIEGIDAIFRDFLIDLIREFRTCCEWLVVVLEYPDRFESVFLYEIHKYLEVLICLPWESDDESSTDKRVRKMLANILDEAIDMCTIIVSSHELQDLLARMLKGDIEIGDHLL